MKTFEGKEVEVKVSPHGRNCWQIYYREKKKFRFMNIFNSWKRYEYTIKSNLYVFDSIPHLFVNFNHAIEEARRLKNNPKLIDINNFDREKKIFEYSKENEEHIKNRKDVIL